MNGKKRLLYLAAAAALLAVLLFALSRRTQPLSRIVGEPFWTSPAWCTVVNTDPSAGGHFDDSFVIGALFPEVSVKKAGFAKNVSLSGDWIALYAACPQSDQDGAYARLEIEVFRERLAPESGQVRYSMNIAGRCYRVVSGEEEIDSFIELVRLRALEDG